MIIKYLVEQKCTLQKLQNLLKDSTRKVHGVYYTNDFFSKRYIARANRLSDSIVVDKGKNTVKAKVTTRMEKSGLMEIENTLDVLVKHKAGDMPGFMPESLLDEDQKPELIAEPISVSQYLYSVDLDLIMENPKVTFQDFTIAGHKFTIVNLYHSLGEDMKQNLSLIFGESDKMYLFSHFVNTNLTTRDSKMILDLIVDENITGKAIRGVIFNANNKVSVSVYPYDELINSYRSGRGNYVFGTAAGAISVPESEISKYRMSVKAISISGAYELTLKGKDNKIVLLTE